MDRERSMPFIDEDEEATEVTFDIKKNLLSEFDSTAVKLEDNHVKVYLRVRPLMKAELEKAEDQVNKS